MKDCLLDRDTEMAAVGSVLINPAIWGEVSGLCSPEDFNEEHLGALWRSFGDEVGPSDDIIAWRAILAKHGVSLTTLELTKIISSVPHSAHAVFYADRVRTLSHLRSLCLACAKVFETIDDTKDPAKVVAFLRNEVSRLGLSKKHSHEKVGK